MAHADLSGSNLASADFINSNLTGVNFSGANLTAVKVTALKPFGLEGAQFTGATKQDMPSSTLRENRFEVPDDIRV